MAAAPATTEGDERHLGAPTFPVNHPTHQCITGLVVGGFWHQMFNGRYVFTGDTVDDLPVFRREQPFKNMHFYIYHRPEPAQWVLNDLVDPTAAAVFCSASDGLHSAWTGVSAMSSAPEIHTTRVAAPAGYRGEAICVSGCEAATKAMGHTDGAASVGCAITARQDGVYLRQGPDDPYEALSRYPHYVKKPSADEDGGPCHIFYHDPSRVAEGPRGECFWALGPRADFVEGLFAKTEHGRLANWKIKPPDRLENEVSISLQHGGDLVAGCLDDLVGLPPK